MQNEAQAQPQQANVSAYPQFCGSWPNDEWPEDALIYQRGDFVDLCAGSHVEHEGESEDRLLKLKGRSQ